LHEEQVFEIESTGTPTARNPFLCTENGILIESTGSSTPFKP